MSGDPDDPRPVVRCIVAWWPQKSATPVLRPKAFDNWQDGKRHVVNSSMTLDEAVVFAEQGFEVIPDPFDLEELTRWEQMHRSRRRISW
jgi:hypothetical protein